MGKSIFDKFSQPKPDPVKALILERLNANHIPNSIGAEMMGVGENTYIKRIRHQHTDEWAWGEVRSICRALKVDVAELRGAVRL